jgi:hypothetical protein
MKSTNISLQVQAVTASTSLQSNYIQGAYVLRIFAHRLQSVVQHLLISHFLFTGNLYYKQATYTYKLAILSAKIVQVGPTYCPTDGSNCTSYEALLKTCQEDQKLTALKNYLLALVKIAAGIAKPDAGNS